MPSFVKNKYVMSVLIITIVVFIFMGISVGKTGEANFVKKTVGYILTPIQKVFFNIGESINNTVEFWSEIKYLKEFNNKLIIENDKLKEENRRLMQLRDENKRLRNMLNLSTNYNKFEIIASEVIAKEFSNWFEVFTIDKGTDDGLSVNDPVITDKGLVGYIYEIGKNYSKVMTILDNDSTVSTILERSRDNVIVKGDITLQDKNLCKMTYITKQTDIVKGDNVITSGLGGIYPKGLLIGKVTEIKTEELDMSYYAYVRPVVDFKRLEEVFVIVNSR